MGIFCPGTGRLRGRDYFNFYAMTLIGFTL